MPADPRRVKELFAAALDLPDLPARQALLDRECAGDAELRQRLQALLHAHHRPQPALDQPLVGIAPAEGNQTGPYRAAATGAVEEQAGAVLAGKYKLIERIGEGGMGSVWLAQQTEPVKRLVAVKLIKGGADSQAVLARFEAERQALALMDHPNIARVLDAGSTERGAPFFVMELVKGVPITQFCDARKLTPRQRLELFIPVCQAIQHAHQKGIIHRDVKPSNVLIALFDDRPVPKVIDFGVAKATGGQLTEHTLHTAFGSVVGTLEYMSPEQATLNNLDIDTRSDIYSLGVLLYELLAGAVPFRRKDLQKAGMLEMLRVIREEEPPRPSTRASTAEGLPSLAANRGMEPAKLKRQLRGEIDWMVMKALDKERSRRYETASGLALDIQRYLADEPVSAGPPSAAYRLRKFVKRNKGQVLAAGLLLMALVAGVVGLGVGLWAVEREREKTQEALGRALTAEEEAKKAEAATLADYRGSTDDAIEQLIGSKPVLGVQEKTYLKKTLKRWQVFAARTGDDERSRAIRAEGLFRVAKLRHKLGQSAEAEAGYREALAIWQKLADEFPAVPEYRQELAGTRNNLGILLEGQNQLKKAAEQYRKALAIKQKLADDFPARPEYRQTLAGTHSNLGALLADQNQWEKSAQQYRKALAIQQKLADDFPAVPQYRKGLASIHNHLGVLLAGQNQWVKAVQQYRKALAIQQKLADEFPAVPLYRDELARTHYNLGNLLAGQNQGEKAAEQYHKALAIRQKLADDFPAVPQYRQDLAATHNNLGALLAGQNQGQKAAQQYRKALAIQQKLADDFPAVPDYRKDLAGTHSNLGALLARQNQGEKAAEQYHKALAIRQKLADGFPAVPLYRQNLAGTHNNLGALLAGQNQGQKAAQQYRKALAIQQKLADDFPAVPDYRQGLASTHLNLGVLLADQNQWVKAVRQYRKALAIQQKLADEFPAVPLYRQNLARPYNNLGNLLARQNQGEKAAEQYHKALAIQQKLADEFPAVALYRQGLASAHLNLGSLLKSQNQGNKSAQQYHKALAIQQKLADEFPAVALYRQDLAATHNNLGNLLAGQNQGAKAAEQYHEALAIQQKLADEFPAVPEYRQKLAGTHNNLGNLLQGQNQWEKAAEHHRKALTIQQKLADDFPAVPQYRQDLAATHNNLGLLLAGQNQGVKAAQHYLKALAIYQKLADDFPAVTAYQVELGGSYCNYGLQLLGAGKPADSLKWFDKAIRTLTRVHQQDPRVVMPRLFLRNSHWNRALAHDRLEKHAEAVKDWNRAIELSPRQQQLWLRARRANSRVRAGQVAEALAEVAELTKTGNWPANQWYDFACIYAVASGKSADKKQEYADRAMALLRKAVKAGYKDAAHLAKDKDLDALRGRDDFKKLLAELEAAARPKKTKEP